MQSYDNSYSGSNQKSSPNFSQKVIEQNQLEFEIDFYSRILQSKPNYIEVLRVMSSNLTHKGEYRRCLKLDQRLTRLCPGDHIAHYNLACSYSLLTMVDSALKSLKVALDLGFDDYEYLREDRDLEAVRKDDRFGELLKAFGIF